MEFVTNAPAADHVNWTVQDYQGNVRGSGSFAVPAGVQTSKITCSSTATGYFALTGTLSNAGGTLPRAGTRPAGIATFGVLPNVSWALPPVTYTSQDQHRFGMQGENDKPALLNALGVTQVLDWRQLSNMEPMRANSWHPTAAQSVANVDAMYKTGQIARLIRLDGIPAWASVTGAFTQDTYAPKDLSYFQGYMARVGADSDAIHKAYFPNMKNNYYQVTWEPKWAGSAESFVSMYKAVYEGLHSTDPHAVVMGVTSPDPGTQGDWGTGYMLRNYASLGLLNYVDGITTHSYYANHPSPAYPPERYDGNPNSYYQHQALDNQLRDLRSEMQTLKPNMRLWSSEVGIAYDTGITYASGPSSNQLFAQAAVAARTHLTVLGEGAQVTYFFYGSDYPTEIGFGTFFDIVNPQGDFHATTLSPKPEALAFAAMTRIIDGTETLGHLNNLPASIYGYAFQQLGNGKVVTALWSHNNANWPTTSGVYSQTARTSYTLTVDAPGTSGKVTVFDMMGNPSILAYTNGAITLTLSETPIYVVSSNANVIKANVTKPVGYTGQ
ncbi:hypothetical protein [Trinickia diaoshuihuensis]|uniref:hypothetical protein n=1 Tax=Trinickia diaoshuihuensis TaxID=2292265 RepID=UPI000E24E4C0|nr:hypothetical protein [Trinickia diaoshuihuensis]